MPRTVPAVHWAAADQRSGGELDGFAAHGNHTAVTYDQMRQNDLTATRRASVQYSQRYTVAVGAMPLGFARISAPVSTDPAKPALR